MQHGYRQSNTRLAFDEVAGIKFKDKDGIQIMKDYMELVLATIWY